MRIKKKVAMSLIFLLIIMLILYLIGEKNKQKNNLIENKGYESVGTIVNRTMGTGDGDITVFGVWFDFYIDGKLIRSNQMLTCEADYNKAIVGMKYKIKYLREKPERNSIIYINEPVLTEYKNIPNERKRIMKTYEDAKWFLDKNAQPLEEIKHLIKIE
jgi:hypothetical protein